MYANFPRGQALVVNHAGPGLHYGADKAGLDARRVPEPPPDRLFATPPLTILGADGAAAGALRRLHGATAEAAAAELAASAIGPGDRVALVRAAGDSGWVPGPATPMAALDELATVPLWAFHVVVVAGDAALPESCMAWTAAPTYVFLRGGAALVDAALACGLTEEEAIFFAGPTGTERAAALLRTDPGRGCVAAVTTYAAPLYRRRVASYADFGMQQDLRAEDRGG